MIRVEKEESSFSRRETEMPKFILATAAVLLRRQFPPTDDAHDDPLHEAMHARTRSRGATRRLRASRVHDPYFDLGPLDLTRRH
jgi:hypothetical protein